MRYVTVTVGLARFSLPVEIDIDALKRRALQMVADGGGFLEIGDPTRRQTSILLTPGVSVVFEVEERAEIDASTQIDHQHDDVYDLVF